MASFTERLGYIITANGRDAIKTFRDVRSSAERDLGAAESRIGKLGAGAKGAGAGLKSFAGGFAGALAAGGLFDFAADAADSFRQVQVWRTKVGTVFENSAEDVRRWADKNNESFGMSDDALAGVAASFGDLLKPMGFTSAEAARMSTQVIGLAGALSAWSGGQRTTAEVGQILSKAMLGERDALKELGISISEADVQAALAARGQQKLTGASLAQAKALATQELLFQRSTDAQKAWADGSLDAVKSQNKLQAELDETREQLGEQTAPLETKAKGLLAGVLGLANKVRDVVNAPGEWARNSLPSLVDTKDAVEEAGDKAGQAAKPTEGLAEALEAVDASAENAKDSLTLYNDALDDTLGAHLEGRDSARSLADAEDDLADALGRGGDEAETSTAKTRSYEDALEDIIGGALDAEEAHDSAADAVERLAEALGHGSENAADFRERLSRGNQTVEGYAEAIRRAARDAIRAVSREVDAMAESGEIADTAGARKAALAERLNDLKRDFPAVAGEIDAYLQKLARVPNLSTESQIATQKVSGSKQDLAEVTDTLIQKAREEADQQDTVIGKYQRMLELLEGLKAKYPEVAAAIQQAIDDVTAANDAFWTDPNNQSWGAAMSRGWNDRNALPGWGRGPGARAMPRGPYSPEYLAGRPYTNAQGQQLGPVGNPNVTINVDAAGLDAEAAADLIGRKVAWAISSGGRR